MNGLTGLEKAFVKEWENWDDHGVTSVQFYGCAWTDYTKSLLPNHEDFDIMFLCGETSKVEFYHKETSSKDVVLNVKLVVEN